MAKSTFNVRTKRWEFFNRECKAASLRRDDFLDRVLPAEIELLKAVPPCDAAGHKWLKANWASAWDTGDHETAPVPITLTDSVLGALNGACTANLVPRDAFFDCAIQFFVQRLLDAVVVIKNPRSTKDLVARMTHTFLQAEAEDIPDKDARDWVWDEAVGWWQGRSLDALGDDFYRNRLHYTQERIKAEVDMLRELGL